MTTRRRRLHRPAQVPGPLPGDPGRARRRDPQHHLPLGARRVRALGHPTPAAGRGPGRVVGEGSTGCSRTRTARTPTATSDRLVPAWLSAYVSDGRRRPLGARPNQPYARLRRSPRTQGLRPCHSGGGAAYVRTGTPNRLERLVEQRVARTRGTGRGEEEPTGAVRRFGGDRAAVRIGDGPNDPRSARPCRRYGGAPERGRCRSCRSTVGPFTNHTANFASAGRSLGTGARRTQQRSSPRPSTARRHSPTSPHESDSPTSGSPV